MSVISKVPPFILASASPRRRELLLRAGFKLNTVTIAIDEAHDGIAEPIEIVRSIATKKLEACTQYLEDSLVLTADTLVFKDDQILGKPVDKNDAVRMLKLLSNSSHSVVTAVCIGHQDQSYTFHVATEVYFAPLDSEMIEYYIENYRPFDKAGAYGIQEWIGDVAIQKINGSYTNVVGLPMYETSQAIINYSDKWLN